MLHFRLERSFSPEVFKPAFYFVRSKSWLKMAMASAHPSQEQVDRIAAYVEAARELQNEPFYHEDEKRSVGFQGDGMSFELGSRFHFRSALVTFRRLWMNDESSHFYSCFNILRQFSPVEMTPILDGWKEKVQEIRSEKALLGLLKKVDEPLKNEELINLWLNAVFAHVSITGDKKRHQFEEYQKKHGHAVMEYSFRNAVWMLGIQYKNMAMIHGESFLKRCDKEFGLKPSFQIGAPFGVYIRETTAEGHLIVRQGSSKFYSEESVEQMVDRICSRSRNRSINNLLRTLELSPQVLARLVFGADSIEQIIRGANKVLKIEEAASMEAFHGETGPRSMSGLFDQATRETSAIMTQGNLITTDAVGVSILNRELASVKDQLRRDSQEAP